MIDITAFLNARFDEDEQAAEAALDDEELIYRPRGNFGPTLARVRLANRFDPGRVIVEVAAKRLVLARHRQPASPAEHPPGTSTRCCIGCGFAGDLGAPRTANISDCPELHDLANAYCEHPDFEVAWTLHTALTRSTAWVRP